MSEETKYLRVRSRNYTMMKMYGDKLTTVEMLISLRSDLVHMEVQFTDRYGGISVSATKADGCDCVRFKMIGYSHSYRWSTIYIPVTAEQEALIFADACRMADWNPDVKLPAIKVIYPDTGCWFGPNAIPYDTAGVSLSFISKRRWWNPSSKRQWCNETVGLLLMVVWPDVFDLVKEDGCITVTVESADMVSGKCERVYHSVPPHEQTPRQTHDLIQHYFKKGLTL
jgi:hypothetical protein